MSERVEALRQQALAKWRTNEFEESLPLLDEALALASDEESRELLAINKAFALISLRRLGPEVQVLPQIIMRRRNANHVLLAAYYLQYKHRLEGDFQRAHSYLRVAMQALEDGADAKWKPELQIELGNIAVYDSRNTEAIAHYEAALELLADTPVDKLGRAICYQNIGYCKVLLDEYESGVELIHRAIERMKEIGADGYLAESYIDLCFGYLGMERLQEAREYGELGLSLAKDLRQIRNAHYLLGEIAFKNGDQGLAGFHFDHLAKFYPDFPHLKDLLLAIDLRAMVNLKL